MKYVEIYKLQNNGEQSVVLHCVLDGDMVRFEGEGKQIAENLENFGIRDYKDESKQNVFSKDGLKFLENLKYNFDSGYLNASDIIEK
ncbi:MAG: hypothetical protein US50_C0023G0005 [Candidatus Nomurabacteria bacterium GW2011_GWB1_37_5]|uniref:Uncharacterized protein n=1 Tax=Candidatus Nomurabacteria bacterium GW2011_GWB1_37_5 TaxID=1618742 RepID=A0A0G0GVZ5_9BACT|nr:MAG: hypothetical protein US50_C0023G0005 [Candidatus Nomurabacteria bacterium GW2011_GWB1_37_5]